MVFTFLFNTFTRSIGVILIAMLSVNYLPDKLFNDFPLEPRSFEPRSYDTVIPQWNTKLSDGQPEFLQLNNMLGPESIAISKEGLVYTGLADGRIVELDPSNRYKIRDVMRFNNNPQCQDDIATHADVCGRFLQLRFLNNSLYAVEANTGLYKIDIKSGAKNFLGPKSINGAKMFNSFAFDSKDPNLVYLTVSSSKWTLLNIMWSIFESDLSGQLVALDISTGERVVVLENLGLVNGIDVDAKRDQAIFSQTLLSSISSLSLKDVRAAFKLATDGDKLRNIEVKSLISLVPGMPDNIIIEGDLAYIALPFVKLNGKEVVDHLGTMPNVKKAVGRFIFGLGKIVEYISVNFYPHPLLESVYRELKCGHVNYRVMKSDKSAVLEYNLATGASRLMGSDTFGFVSEAVPDRKGNLLLGSFRSPFIVKQRI